MTRKDYIVLAEALLKSRTEYERPNWNHAIDHVVEQVADVLEADNPNFKRALFVQAATGVVALTARKAVA